MSSARSRLGSGSTGPCGEEAEGRREGLRRAGRREAAVVYSRREPQPRFRRVLNWLEGGGGEVSAVEVDADHPASVTLAPVGPDVHAAAMRVVRSRPCLAPGEHRGEWLEHRVREGFALGCTKQVAHLGLQRDGKSSQGAYTEWLAAGLQLVDRIVHAQTRQARLHLPDSQALAQPCVCSSPASVALQLVKGSTSLIG